jgi:hypothetical protein
MLRTPSNVRHIEEVGWQVMLENSSQWHTCSDERDARFIASGMRLANSVARGETFGREVAEELDAPGEFDWIKAPRVRNFRGSGKYDP